jgi:putative DNA primase/helicase
MAYDRDAGTWKPDPLRVEHLAKEELPLEICVELAQAEGTMRDKLGAGFKRVCSRAGLVAALEMARSEPDLAARGDDFDADLDLVNAADCVIDTRTGGRLPHDPKYMMTRRLWTIYEPDAAAPLWLAHLERVTDGRPGLVSFWETWLGYCLTGHTSEQCIAIPWGTGANGKSVTTETARAVIGTYAMHAAAATFMSKRRDSSSGDLARLAGARLVTASETGSAHRLEESLVKQVTGSEPVTARFLFHDEFEFVPRFKLTLSTNHKPNIVGTDRGIWRRIRLVPFDVVIPEAEQDHDLTTKLRDELPGILAWMVAGCLRWRTEGLAVPDEVRSATASYQLEMDPLAEFLAEHVIDDPDGTVPAGWLYERYVTWAKATGENVLSQRAFSARLSERGLKTSSRLEPVTRRKVYRGFRLADGSEGPQL